MNAHENQIVVYQPDETIRLDVRLENETVWLTQEQIANLFGTKRPAITKHLANIYKSGELEREGTCSILEHMGNDGRQESDFEAFGAQCGKFTKTICGICHDRFIIVDQKEIFWTGASLKDVGRLTFAAAKMGAEVIPGLLESVAMLDRSRRKKRHVGIGVWHVPPCHGRIVRVA